MIYSVIAPYSYVLPILDYGAGPTEYAAHHLYVRATTKRRAMWLALRAWRRQFRTGKMNYKDVPPCIDEGDFPLKHIKAEATDHWEIT